MEPPEKYGQNNCQQISPDIIKHWHPKLSRRNNWFLGGPFGEVSGGGGVATPNYTKIFVC